MSAHSGFLLTVRHGWPGRVGRGVWPEVWGKLTAGLGELALASPSVSSWARARRRIGVAPLRRLFEVLAGPVAVRGQAGASPGICEGLVGAEEPCVRGRAVALHLDYLTVVSERLRHEITADPTDDTLAWLWW